ncbi:MAG: preprotein translocase subunit SecG [Kiritimatiellae bacterium]|nr:preprotein translocase subunit SecG [Kiritimatiellia bacterium]
MTQFFIGLLYVVEIVVCLLLVLVVMLQKPKEGGLGGAISGGMLESTLGADAGNVLIKATAILGAIFLCNTLLLARLTSVKNARSIMAGEEPAAVVQEVPSLPGLTDLPQDQTPAVPAAPATPQAPVVPAPVAPAAPAPVAPAAK